MPEGTVHTITLRSAEHYGHRAPAAAIGAFLHQLTLAVAQSVKMSFVGTSELRGRWPRWVAAASDLRLIDYGGEDETRLHFEIPRLGEAVPELYRQGEFWPNRPDRRDTGLDLLADTISDVVEGNTDSERFDSVLLGRLSEFRGVVRRFFREILITGRRHSARRPCILDESVVTAAKELRAQTPPPQRVRVVGQLDMIRASTRTFALKLDSGEEVRGVFLGDEIEELRGLWQQRVLVVGRAVYRPSGGLLRIDADAVTAASQKDRFFSTIPRPRARKFDLRQAVQKRKRGIAAIFGKWPGEETDEEVWRAVEELS